MTEPIVEGTGQPCRIPGCKGYIVQSFEMRSNRFSWETPRYGGPPPGQHKHLTSTHCEACGVKYAFARGRVSP